jgi:hypothetical protein
MAISPHDLLGACLALTALRHLSFDDADDGHENRASNPAATHIGEDALQIHSAATRGSGTHHHLKNRAAETAAVLLILELDRPFDGLIQISSEPMRNSLRHLGQ